MRSRLPTLHCICKAHTAIGGADGQRTNALFAAWIHGVRLVQSSAYIRKISVCLSLASDNFKIMSSFICFYRMPEHLAKLTFYKAGSYNVQGQI